MIMRDGERARACEGGSSRAPIVVSSCWALYKRGAYGAQFGAPVDTWNEIEAEILRLKNAGADIIKVMASGIVSLKKPGTVSPGGFDRTELRCIVDLAGSLGLDVMAHANGEPAITAAAEAGVRSIEHGFFMTVRALDMMSERGTYWIPTVGALARAVESRETTVETRQHVAGLIAAHLNMLQRAHAIGVPLAVGTDCVLPDPHYQEVYDAELSYFRKSGISSAEVMRIAGEGGARLLGFESI
jgi:imidazolonepropionase-like amidohydrolase